MAIQRIGTALVAFAALHGAALRAANEMAIDTVAADGGANGVSVSVTLTNDEAIHAFSVALSFDAAVLTLNQVLPGSAVQALGSQFFQPKIDNAAGTATIGSIFSYDTLPFQRIELGASPTQPVEIARLVFDVAADAPAGPSTIEFAPSVGDPPISNVFSAAGTTLHPTALEPGAVSVINENVLKLDDVLAVPGQSFNVAALGQHAQPLQGFSIAFTYDKSLLTYVSATSDGTDASLSVQPQSIEFFSPLEEPDFTPTLSRISVGVIADFVTPLEGHVISASSTRFQSLARFTFSVVNDPTLVGQTSDLVLTDVGIPGEIDNQFVIDNRSFAPDFVHGSVEFVDTLPGKLFRRGFVNTDDRVDISDGISILRNVFLGDATPPCIKAADVNDDTRYDISDSIFILVWQFIGGSQPFPPFESCGIDPTDDNLTCDSFPLCE